MDLSEILREECIQIGTDAKSKVSVLETIADLATKCKPLSLMSPETVLGALKERENLGSTGFGNGVAIPHCALDKSSEFVVGILIVPNGVEFDSLDGNPTRVLVFIIGPSAERNKHISVLAAVSQVLRIPGAVNEILAAKDPAIARECFLRYSLDEVESGEQTETCLFHVFVQNDEKFYEILQVFSAMETCPVSVVEAKDASAYLHDIPLFRSLWSNEPKGECKILTAVVRKYLANDTIRQINDIAGGLDKVPGVIVAVQDIFYGAGTLN